MVAYRMVAYRMGGRAAAHVAYRMGGKAAAHRMAGTM
jgi:hypothetical protein